MSYNRPGPNRGFQSRGGPGGNRDGRPSFNRYSGPPSEVIPIGEVTHAAEGQLVCKVIGNRVPHFNGRLFLENKTQVGQVDEILGPINGFMFSAKMMEGMVASSFKSGSKLYIDPVQLLPLERFLPKPPIKKVKGKPGEGGRPSGPGGFNRGGPRQFGGAQRGGFGGGRPGQGSGGFQQRQGGFGGQQGGFGGQQGGNRFGGQGGSGGGYQGQRPSFNQGGQRPNFGSRAPSS